MYDAHENRHMHPLHGCAVDNTTSGAENGDEVSSVRVSSRSIL